jgi:hypothetical protein
MNLGVPECQLKRGGGVAGTRYVMHYALCTNE